MSEQKNFAIASISFPMEFSSLLKLPLRYSLKIHIRLRCITILLMILNADIMNSVAALYG